MRISILIKWCLFGTIIASLLQIQGCTNAATKAYNKGVKKQQQGEHNYAIEFFKISLAKGGSKARLNYLIAENYRLTNRIAEAGPFYAKALAAGSKEDRAVFYYAQSLKSNANYVDARIFFEKYVAGGLNKNLVAQAKAEVDFLTKVDELRNRQTFYEVMNMGNDINTDGPEYAPVFDTKTAELIYTGSNNQFEYTAIGSGFTDIYAFKFDGAAENTGVKREFIKVINSNRTHEACAAVANDAGTVIFAKSNDGKRKGSIDTDLYVTELRDEVWTEPQILKNVSDPRYWESTPAFSTDNKTLYFASNRKGGFGGIDLYKATYSDSAGWGNVTNLGPQINTSGNEMFPYERYDGKFFFASDGHPGLGRLDVFVVHLDTLTNEKRIDNLGTDINSNADDFGVFYKDKMTGYFASNRKGGKGDDDIYEFKLGFRPAPLITKEMKSFLIVHTNQSAGPNSEPTTLDSALVMLRPDSLASTATGYTNKEGNLTFPISDYLETNIVAEKSNYFSNSYRFSTAGAEYRQDSVSPALINRYYTINLNLQKIRLGQEIVLEHIYYDYNKADIRLDAEPDLQLLIEFLKKNPGVIIELGSHTDARGNDAYNLTLSKARAKSAVDYILRHGIDESRIKPIGYGETKHMIPNAQTEEEHQINRRTEFKIIDIRN